MKRAKTETPRYVGVDLGKRTYVAAFVDGKGKVTMGNGTTGAAGRQALYGKLRPTDKVALEAGNMAFVMAKEIGATVGCTVYVLNPSGLAVIYRSMKKTDKEDALKLAHILEDCREERLPTVPVPSDEEMAKRKLVSSHRREQKCRTAAINRLHGMFVSQGITSMVRKDLATAGERRTAVEKLAGLERKEAEHLLKCLVLHEERIAELEAEMAEEVAGSAEIDLLRTVPGVGPKVSFAFFAYVRPERFENASQVSNYLGLAPRVYMSGDTVRYGRITKSGNGYVRALLVQAAWALVRSKAGGRLKERYEEMTAKKGMSKKKAIVALARRIAELMYVLMRDGKKYDARPPAPGRQKQGGEALAVEALVA